MWQLSEFQCPRDTSASKSGRCFLACSNHAWQARHLHQNQFLQWRATRTIPTSLSNLSTRDLRNLREMKILLGPLNPETACRNSSLGLRCSLGSEVMNMTQKNTLKNIKTPLGAKWLCRKFRENYMENSKNDGWWWVMIIFHKEFQALQPHKKVTFMAGGYPRGWIPDCRDETPSILPFLKWHAASRSLLILECFDMNVRSFSGSIQSLSIYSFSWDCILTYPDHLRIQNLKISDVTGCAGKFLGMALGTGPEESSQLRWSELQQVLLGRREQSCHLDRILGGQDAKIRCVFVTIEIWIVIIMIINSDYYITMIINSDYLCNNNCY